MQQVDIKHQNIAGLARDLNGQRFIMLAARSLLCTGAVAGGDQARGAVLRPKVIQKRQCADGIAGPLFGQVTVQALVAAAAHGLAPFHLRQKKALTDQHAYLNFAAADPSAAPKVGDRIELGISHPCTTFDKWRWMPIVEDDGRVSGAIHTRF